MGLREPLNVTVLNQIEVKYEELLVVLFGNPFIDAVESEDKKKKKDLQFKEKEKLFLLEQFHSDFIIQCQTLLTSVHHLV